MNRIGDFFFQNPSSKMWIWLIVWKVQFIIMQNSEFIYRN